MKWHGFGAERVVSRFTVFSHEPHIGAQDSNGCMSCHAMTTGGDTSDYLATYKAGDPSVFVSNFKLVDKSVCAACHTPDAAGEKCTLCHDYHANAPTSPMVQTKLP